MVVLYLYNQSSYTKLSIQTSDTSQHMSMKKYSRKLYKAFLRLSFKTNTIIQNGNTKPKKSEI